MSATDPRVRRMTRTRQRMDLQFSGEVGHWRGPAPFYFVTVPDEESGSLRAVSSAVTYGWGGGPVGGPGRGPRRGGGALPPRLADVAVPQGRRVRRPAQGRRAPGRGGRRGGRGRGRAERGRRPLALTVTA